VLRLRIYNLYAKLQHTSFFRPEIATFIRTDGHGYRPLYGQSYNDSAIDPDQEYIGYKIFNESSIPFNSLPFT